MGLRDHVHEAGILKAMGLTPRQASGMGWGIAVGLSPATIAAFLAAALAAAVAAALFLSARAAHAQDPLLAARAVPVLDTAYR